jgi:S-DNA-T family DNA segregation ATPase FtsK/SpoIIIE
MARDDEVDAIRDLLDELDGIVAARKRLYSEHFIDSADEFRVHRQTLPDQSHPDIFLMIDRLPDFLPYLDRIQALAGVGLEYAVHVVVTARSWREVPETLAELIHCKIELNLDSPQESRVNPQLAQRHVNDAPGWAIRRDSRFLIALPHLGSAGGDPPEAISLSAPDGARELVDRITAAWPETGRDTPAVKRDVAPLTVAPTVLELLGIDEISAEALKIFRSAVTESDRLQVPFAVDSRNRPVLLDLKEAALGGMGPHGLLIGATGSGKSELLRTLVTALALKHDSQTVNFVLIDLKGGATFSGLSRLPHLSALVTNLVDDLSLVDRVVAVLEGELLRRQELLRRSGNWASQRDYEKARRGGVSLQPVPSLLVICDEFSELLSARPDFFDLLIQISRLGRSLGVHLLLSGQRLEEGRLRGLETYLSYRIALRTFSALESRAVVDVPDAYELPRTPGHGLLRVGTEPVRRLLTATTFRSMPGEQETMLSTAESVAEFLGTADAPARPMWLPPLDVSPTLDEVLGPVALVAERGITCANSGLRGTLRVPIALVDKPRQHERDVLWLELDEAAGHVAIVGSVASGKSTAMRSLICGLALTHTPAEVQIYCLDFGGGSLATLRDLPHVGGVFGRLDRDGVRRTVGEISTLLTEREMEFASNGIASMATYRPRRPARPDGQPFGDVFLFIDGWATLRKEFEELEPVITDIATRGLPYGIHVVASTPRWMDFRPVIRDLFGSKLELRLSDPTDSLVNRRAAVTVPQKPGRGIVEQPTGNESLHLLTVRPELSSMDTAALVKAIATNWHGPVAPRVRMLPYSVPYSELDVEHSPGLRLPIGIAEADLREVGIDFAADPHFLCFGDSECGKTSFLRSLATSIIRKYTPEQARMIVVDYRRGLFDLPESEHRIGYGTAAQGTLELMQSVAGSMQRRLPGPDVTAQQLRDRSWWTGPELFVLVDDYDLVVAGSTNPLTPLLEYLPQARDLGLHLVLARRSGGASRALFEPVIQRLRELSAPGLVMSGSSDEGALIGGIRPAPMPAGRGLLVTRLEDVRLIQVAYLPPDS